MYAFTLVSLRFNYGVGTPLLWESHGAGMGQMPPNPPEAESFSVLKLSLTFLIIAVKMVKMNNSEVETIFFRLKK